MSYTWQNGDLITAERLNNTGGSVATVIVDFNDGGWPGSVVVFVGYAKTTGGRNSIESPMMEWFSAPPLARMYISVCVPAESDDYSAYIMFNDFIDADAIYTVSGDISQTKTTLSQRLGDASWASEPLYGFKVSGDGMITVAYNG